VKRPEIINDNLVLHHDNNNDNDDHHNNNQQHQTSSTNNNNADEKGLGMKGERLSKFFVVEQRNKRLPYHVPHKRKRMFDDDLDLLNDKKALNEKRRQKVREEFQWAWNSYRHLAWGFDELHPVSKRPRSWVEGTKGFAMTIFDSLDTLYIMNLTSDFNDAVTYLYSTFNLHVNAGCSTFEATIRLLGGTLSSFELSGDARLLRLAEKVGWILIAGLETSNGMLMDHVNFKTRGTSSMGWLNGNNLVSELGSLQLEFRTLSFHIRDPIFDMRVTHLMSVLKSGCSNKGYVCPTMFNFHSGRPSSSGYTLGGMADSYFEYVVKQYVLTGGVEEELEEMATRMMKTIHENMILEARVPLYDAKPSPDGKQEVWTAVFPGFWSGMDGQKPTTSSLEHLTCFAGGMFALAALNMKNLPAATRQQYAQTGHDMTETCANMYFSQNSGLAPEQVEIGSNRAFSIDKNEYRLRPETVESIFYMWRITGDEMYREWTWTIFDSLMKFCRMPWGGYSGVNDVGVSEVPDPEKMQSGRGSAVSYDDIQQSYFMAETMKYIYLTFADPSVINLEEWVFNTESHPVKIRQRDPREIWYEWREKHDGKPRWVAPQISGVKAFYPELEGNYKIQN
jgi:mannosyl-oligosaccharide alpha-1,2-mannosidase